MKVVLVDNGSLEPAAHEGLRAAASALAAALRVDVEAVSWKHSDRIDPALLGSGPARTLAPWVRSQVSAGEREFLFVPFFISPQGAIGSALRGDLGRLQAETGGFEFSFAEGLADTPALAAIVADRIAEAASAHGLRRPAVVVVDHGGPSRASAEVRDRVAAGALAALGERVGTLRTASMESPQGAGFEHNRPLLADALRGLGAGDVIIAPLFLLPGRHAGPGGDLERIAADAEAASPGLRCRFTGLVGSHPAAIEALAASVAAVLRAGAVP
jgi:sirohydrochlorin ferrochelatase